MYRCDKDTPDIESSSYLMKSLRMIYKLPYVETSFIVCKLPYVDWYVIHVFFCKGDLMTSLCLRHQRSLART